MNTTFANKAGDWFRVSARRRSFVAGFAALCLAATPLLAGELPLMAGKSIDLGRFRGIVYYTEDDGRFRVVATIAYGEAGSPVRFSATLADNQSATLSVPGEIGEPGYGLEISRAGDTIVFTETGRTSDL